MLTGTRHAECDVQFANLYPTTMRGISLALFGVYGLVLVILTYHLPFSLLYSTFHSFDDLFRFVENANQARTKKGRDYFSGLDSPSSLNVYKQQLQNTNLLLAIGIISIKRSQDFKKHESFGYLFQSASSIDNLVKNDKFINNSFAFVCNVDQFPKSHSDAQEVSQFMPYVERYGDNSMGLTQDLKVPNSNVLFKNIESHKSVYEKETYDYVFCLNAAATLKPKYVLLVEEDSIPHKDFTFVLDYLLKYHLDGNHHRDTFYFKFYFPSKWQGFSLRLTEVMDLLSFSTLGATIYCLILYACSVQFQQRQYDGIKKDFLVGFFVSMVSCYVLGRQNLNEIRRLSPYLYRIQSSEQCCTQAMLYPTQIVPRLSEFMVSQAVTAHTDLLIWDFADMEGLSSYQVEPNLFFHTGLHSTLPLQQKHPEEFIFLE